MYIVQVHMYTSMYKQKKTLWKRVCTSAQAQSETDSVIFIQCAYTLHAHAHAHTHTHVYTCTHVCTYIIVRSTSTRYTYLGSTNYLVLLLMCVCVGTCACVGAWVRGCVLCERGAHVLCTSKELLGTRYHVPCTCTYVLIFVCLRFCL